MGLYMLILTILRINLHCRFIASVMINLSGEINPVLPIAPAAFNTSLGNLLDLLFLDFHKLSSFSMD